MNDKCEIEVIFINQLKDFIKELQNVFYDIEYFKCGEKYITTMNEKYIINSWKKYISNPYMNEIQTMDINNVMTKIKKTTLKKNKNCYGKLFFLIMNNLEQLSINTKKNIMHYIYNLSQLSLIYDEKL
jgi:hypothetical protein